MDAALVSVPATELEPGGDWLGLAGREANHLEARGDG